MSVFENRSQAVQYLNSNCAVRTKKGKYLTGVKSGLVKGTYVSYIGIFGWSKNKYLGCFNDEIKAHLKWKEAKESYILEISTDAFINNQITKEEFDKYNTIDFLDSRLTESLEPKTLLESKRLEQIKEKLLEDRKKELLELLGSANLST